MKSEMRIAQWRAENRGHLDGGADGGDDNGNEGLDLIHASSLEEGVVVIVAPDLPYREQRLAHQIAAVGGTERRQQMLEPLQLNAQRVVGPRHLHPLRSEEFVVERGGSADGEVRSVPEVLAVVRAGEVWLHHRQSNCLCCTHHRASSAEAMRKGRAWTREK